MPAILDLNNAFVYYLAAVLPQTRSRRFADYLGVLSTGEITLSLSSDDVAYDPSIDVAQLQGTPEVLATSTFANDTSVMNSSVFRQSSSTSASFSTSTTKGLKIGAQTKLTTGIPFLAGGAITLSAEGSLSSTQSNSSTETQTFAVDTTVNVPPQSQVKANLVIYSVPYSGTLTAKVQVNGRLFVNFGSTHLRFQMADIFNALKAQPPGNFTFTDNDGHTFAFSDSDLALFEVTAMNTVLFTATADIEATFGARQTVMVQQFELTSGQMVNQTTLPA